MKHMRGGLSMSWGQGSLRSRSNRTRPQVDSAGVQSTETKEIRKMRLIYKALAALLFLAVPMASSGLAATDVKTAPSQFRVVGSSQAYQTLNWGSKTIGIGGPTTVVTSAGSGTIEAPASGQDMINSWMSGNMLCTVKTARKPNENAESQVQRHKAGVTALAAAYPPNAPPPPPSGGLTESFLNQWYHDWEDSGWHMLVQVRTASLPGLYQPGNEAQAYAAQVLVHQDGVSGLSSEYP